MPRKRKPSQTLPREEQPPAPETTVAMPGPAEDPPPADDPAPAASWPSGLTPAEERLRVRALAELARRRAEALVLYEPLPSQDGFHKDPRKIRLARGSNRAGKTLATCVEVARCVTECDPYNKWPKGQGGRFVLVGKDGRHVGQVLYRKLFRAGAFKILRDDATGLWRAMRPGDDPSRAKPAPPLIPPRLVDSQRIAWENKRESIPSLVPLKNGWEINFFSSLGKPPQGWDVDGVDFDEEIVDQDWFPEMVARLLDRGGRMIWGATPQAATEHLFSLHERAAASDPDVGEHFMGLWDNPFITDAEKVSFAASLSEEEHRVRVRGEFAITGYKVYPEFDMRTHGCEPFEIPANWARYMVTDPGRQVCAVLFAAVPPDESHVYLYGELYLRNCTAETYGERVAQRIGGGYPFEAFIIDHSGGRLTDIGSGRCVEDQYSEQLAKRKIASNRSGPGFIWGSDDRKGGLEATRGWLRVAGSGKPKLQVFAGHLPNFERECKYFHHKRVNGILTDDVVAKNDHLMDCFRYLAAYDPRYVKPKGSKGPKPYVIRYLEEKRKRARKKDGPDYVRLG